jgi:hypothetical protein
MKKLLTLLPLSPLAFAEEIDTIIIVLNTKSDEYIDRQRSRA